MVWDTGAWTPPRRSRQGLQEGHLELRVARQEAARLLDIDAHAPAPRQQRAPRELAADQGQGRFAKPGDADALLEEEDKSAQSGRTMDKIAGAGDKVWQSNLAGPKKKPSRRAALRDAGRRVARQATPRNHRASAPAATRVTHRSSLSTQLPTLVTKAPAGAQWLHEIKLDGYRVFCRIEGGKARFFTRKGLDWTDKFGALARDTSTSRGRQRLTERSSSSTGKVSAISAVFRTPSAPTGRMRWSSSSSIFSISTAGICDPCL